MNVIRSQSTSAIINLSNVSPRLYSFFSQVVDTRQQALELLHQLLSHADVGEYDAAEPIWKLFPDLLTCRGIVFHPNKTYVPGQAPVAFLFHKNPGRYKYVGPTGKGVTIWQMALMNEEYGPAEEMGKMMTQEEKKKQFVEIFPDGKIQSQTAGTWTKQRNY